MIQDISQHVKVLGFLKKCLLQTELISSTEAGVGLDEHQSKLCVTLKNFSQTS